MKIIDEARLQRFREKTRCENCGIMCLQGCDPHHLWSKGIGGGGRIDLDENLIALCRLCHRRFHDGHISREHMLAIVAKRERKTPEEITDIINRVRNKGKGMSLSIHRIAEQWPEVTGKAYDQIKESIHKNGLHRPILIWNGQVVDGRTRLRACQELGIDCATEELQGDEASAIARVIDENDSRRHLSESAKTLAYANAYGMYEEAAKKRQAEAGKANLPNPKIHESSSNDDDSQNTGKTQKRKPKSTRTCEKIAEKAGVSPKQAERAIKITKHAPEEVKKAVSEDKVSIADAAEVAKKPHEVQRQALAKVEAGEAKTLKEAVKIVEEATGEIRDSRGRIIPEHLMDKYHAQEDLAAQLAILDKAQPIITKCENILDRSVRYKARELLSQTRNALKSSLAGFVCPTCEGHGDTECACCAGRQWYVGGDSTAVQDHIWRKGA